MKKLNFISLVLLAFLVSAGSVFAQETESEKEEKKGSYYTISTYKVGFHELSDFLKLMDETKVIITENEFILSQKVMTHVWGEDWSVVTIIEYADFSSIEKAQKRMGELLKEHYPDGEKRKELMAKQQRRVKGHYDSIVREVASLAK